MRRDELDKSHQEFKKVILDQNLTEEQLDEILPALAMGAAAAGRAALQVGTMAARGVGALARGAVNVAGRVAQGVGQAAGRVAQGVGRAATSTARGVGKAMTPQPGIPGGSNQSQGTIGSQPTQKPGQTKFVRGQKVAMPTADKSQKQAEFTVSAASADEVELRNPKPKKGEPTAFKFKKADVEKNMIIPQQ